MLKYFFLMPPNTNQKELQKQMSFVFWYLILLIKIWIDLFLMLQLLIFVISETEVILKWLQRLFVEPAPETESKGWLQLELKTENKISNLYFYSYFYFLFWLLYSRVQYSSWLSGWPDPTRARNCQNLPKKPAKESKRVGFSFGVAPILRRASDMSIIKFDRLQLQQ